MLFGGTLVRQPVFANLRKQKPGAFRVVGDLSGADRILSEAIFIGTYPGLTQEMLGYVVETVRKFAKRT